MAKKWRNESPNNVVGNVFVLIVGTDGWYVGLGEY
jgi:hypothetical protein